jgi:hypothetical protein
LTSTRKIPSSRSKQLVITDPQKDESLCPARQGVSYPTRRIRMRK